MEIDLINNRHIYKIKGEQLTMTKQEHINTINILKEQIKEEERIIAEYDKTLHLKSYDKVMKPFKKWDIYTIQSLYDVNQKSYEWLRANQDKDLEDYNQYAYTEGAVLGYEPVKYDVE